MPPRSYAPGARVDTSFTGQVLSAQPVMSAWRDAEQAKTRPRWRHAAESAVWRPSVRSLCPGTAITCPEAAALMIVCASDAQTGASLLDRGLHAGPVMVLPRLETWAAAERLARARGARFPSLPGQPSAHASHNADPDNSHICVAASDNLDVKVNTRTFSPTLIAPCKSA